jgi:hypothetical protein
MALNLDDIESQITDAKDAVLNNETITALDTLSGIQNQMIILDEKPQLLQDISSIRDSLSNNDTSRAVDDLTKIQNQITMVKNQYPELTNSNSDSDNGEDE